MNKKVIKETEFAGRKLILETGELAVQANMAVKATYGDTVVLVTVVAGEANPDIDFFPLTVNYEEKLYASGLIKSSRFVKRMGRPTDEAVITKRLIDHAIRPLFPSDYMDDVQVIATVLSLDEDADPEFLSMLATSAALSASNIPWEGPMVSVRVGMLEDKFVVNPTYSVLEEDSRLNMMVSFVGSELKFLATEAEIDILPEEKVLEAFNFARDNLGSLYDFIVKFAEEVNPDNQKYEYTSKKLDEELITAVKGITDDFIDQLMQEEYEKIELKEKQDDLMGQVFTSLEGQYKKADMVRAFQELEKRAIQRLILEDGKRPDGRKVDEIRNLSSKVGVLPRTHGSALFTRGVTQILTVATLGSPSLELLIQDMYGETAKRYIHYYNFPPFSVGETGRIGYPKSREIGHGMLAEKALRPVIPTQKEFPYTILLVSETLSSSGSSSMASACGSSLALMDAGVPIKDMVAGIGIGIITNDDFSKYKILTDLAYMEDAFGYLDYKMTGTKEGVTAIQSDMKVKGIPIDILPEIIEQSRKARIEVLDSMSKVISKPRESVSVYAPKVDSIKISPEKIGTVIGPGGKTIREIQENTDTIISIEEDGLVTISGTSAEGIDKAKETVHNLTKDIKVGDIYEGTVTSILDFGALVEVLPGKVGLLHISELADKYVEEVTDYVKEGDTIKVKVIEVGDRGKFSLSKKALK